MKIKIALLSLFLCACSHVRENTDATQAWISTHRKPIICIDNRSWNDHVNGERKYTLYSDTEIFDTKNISIALPDTIK